MSAITAIPEHSNAPHPGEFRYRGDSNSWLALRYFNIYRLVISGLFAALSLSGTLPQELSDINARLFSVVAFAFVSFAIVAQVWVERRSLRYDAQVYGVVLVDITAITLLMHAAGGVTSGLGMLLIVSIAGACLLASGRAAVFFAALASFAFLGETVFGALYLGYTSATYTQAGLLGAACFGTAVLASILAERARRGEALAAERAVDIENLSLLNEYIVQRMRSGIVVINAAGDIVLANDAAVEILGTGEQPLVGPLSASAASLDTAYQAWRESGRNPERALSTSGSLDALISFTELGDSDRANSGTLVFLEDAAATRQRAQQLKLASLGRLTASIAHEIRNPLGAISHASQLLSESTARDEADARLTHIIAQHTERVNTIIENILMLGRRKEVMFESLDLYAWLEDFAAELSDRHALAAGDLEIAQNAPDNAVRITMDKSQLHQVLWNLCENALRYAGSQPRLRFEIEVDLINGRPFLDVVDSGPGVDPALVDSLFEPFATGEADGTGLGLYIARELCESNQATLSYVPQPAGSRFRVTFAHPERQLRGAEL